MKLIFEIYLLGSVISLLMTLITLAIDKKRCEAMIDHTNDELSEKFDYYERINFININTVCIINFFMSWAKVVMLLYAYLPSWFFIKMYYYRFLSIILIWITTKIGKITHIVVDKYNNLVKEYNEKHGIKE